MRWDVHNHAVPREAVELLRSGDGYPIKVDGNFMEADRVRAELTPERLRWLAHVPLQATDAAAELLAEAARAGAVGAQIGTSVAGMPLSEAGLDPFWAAAENHDMALMLHPAYNNPHPGLEGYHFQNAIGNQLETTIAAERLIVTGVLDRHPGLRLLLVHAGGYMPWQAGRLRHAATVRAELADSPPDPHAYFGRILVDTITHDAAGLRFLVERGGRENVVMGTDLPFDMATPEPVTALEEAVDPDTARLVAEETPRRLFAL